MFGLASSIASTKTKVLSLALAGIAVSLVLLLWNPDPKKAESADVPLVLYCAAGIKPPVSAAALEYEERFGIPIQLQYGGSGTLLSNLRITRTGDLYVAGDSSYIEIAREQGLVADALPLARLRPVIAVAQDNPRNVRSIDDFVREDVRVGLGNPDAASVGKQTRKLLKQSGDWDAVEEAVRARGVFKPTVNELANDLKIGTIDAAVIWDCTANQYPEIEIVGPVSGDATFSLQVTIGVLTCSQRPTEALRFARFLAGRDQGLRRFAEHGYSPVDGDAWEETPEILLFSGGVNRIAIEDTIRAFEEREGVRVTRVYNGCGILVSQMKAGARPDAYFACDTSFMKQVRDLFDEPVDISETDMIIAVPKGNPRGIASLEDLATEGLKLGVANPRQSALGALTKGMLAGAGLLDAVMKNVKSQTPTADMLVNQLRTETLDAVIVYEANVSQVKEHLDIVRIDLPSAQATQPFAIAKDTKHRHLVSRLLEALKSADSRERHEQTGFRWRLPPEQP